MADIVLTARQQDSLRHLMALEAVPGVPPPRTVIDLVDRLVPSDSIEIDLADASGHLVEQLATSSASVLEDLEVYVVPLALGLVHHRRRPGTGAFLHHHGSADGVTLGFRRGPDHVVQLAMDRWTRTFTDEDLALLRMISPALERLMRSEPTSCLSASLTSTERRALQVVASGRSNAEIAADLFVSVATVRKHLENTYRKLGVHNRMAAVVVLEGHAVPDDAEPVEKYA